MKVYIAAPMGEAVSADELAVYLRMVGYVVVSDWHRTCLGVKSDPASRSERLNALTHNMHDLDMCDVVVALTNCGNPRATYCEIGYALSNGKPLLWVQGEGGEGANIFDAHGLVTVTRQSDHEAIVGHLLGFERLVEAMAAVGRARR